MDRTFDWLRAFDADWIALCAAHGYAVHRSDAAWVSYDGHGTIQVAPDDALDADDTLAQILLHELCHATVEGAEARHAPDWGLDNLDDRDRGREHAALRLQAALVDRHGLRPWFPATTDFRPYWDALPDAPLRTLDLLRAVPPAVAPVDETSHALALEAARDAWAACEGTPLFHAIDALLARVRAARPSPRPPASERPGSSRDTSNCHGATTPRSPTP